ncbi:unnamed protein product [Cyclocybe aegerita]|uniref:MYND-type domain-containing protein n=1 Tax=Cyclocybe aegerita TaxID=1973307 RepID=A0A8S0WAE3_CYCAE|nr:unnamed protein product [Cyclocybe aegerita]
MSLCAHCNAPSSTRCSLCQSVYYCSPEHIRADWPSHKLDCYVKPPKDALSLSDCVRKKVTGILFAEDADEPRLIQLNVLIGYTRTGQTWQTLNLRPYLPDDEKRGRARVRLDGPMVPGEGGIKLGLMSDVFYRRNFTSDGSQRNRCIERSTKGKMAHPWSGPFIMLRRTHLDTSYDVVMEQDLPMLMKFFTTGQMSGFS